jgi:cob(I)alamin adenosyltransferase
MLLVIQRNLYALMTELAAVGQTSSPFAGNVTAAHVDQLESWIAELEQRVAMPKEFVIPGDSQAGAALHMGRTLVRRAERFAVRLAHDGLLGNNQVLRYLNRLSSLLFVLACDEDSRATGDNLTRSRQE